MTTIIAISNQKGGVGKTTTSISLASSLVQLGKKVLLIDFDPQGNCSRGVGVDPTSLNKTIFDVLVNDYDINRVIKKTAMKNLDIVPANLKLSATEGSINGTNDGFYLLKKHLGNIVADYDYMFIDCPPSLGFLTVNALCAADKVLIPVQCEYFALEGVSQVLSSIAKVQSKYNESLEIMGFLLTMYDPRTRLATEVTTEIRGLFRERTFTTQIPRNISLAEAAAKGKPINIFKPTASGSVAYLSLAKEIING